MEESDIKRLGLILAIQAEIEAMKAANITSFYEYENVAYTEDHFQGKAEELREIVSKHRDQF